MSGLDQTTISWRKKSEQMAVGDHRPEQKTKVMIMEDLKSNTNVNVYMVVFMYD